MINNRNAWIFVFYLKKLNNQVNINKGAGVHDQNNLMVQVIIGHINIVNCSL